MTKSRANVVSSFTIIKGSLIDETYAVFRDWDFTKSKFENLRRVREENSIAASSAHWARDVAKVLNRRFAPNGRDRALVELAIAGCDLEVWKPLLLFHLTRDEFLVRDFILHFLYPLFADGAYRVHPDEVGAYLTKARTKPGIEWAGAWTDSTTERVVSGLLRLATDFGLLKGTQNKELTSYHLPDESFLYLLHAFAQLEPNPRRLVDAEDWRLFFLSTADVERELLRLHQFRKVHYEAAGSLVQLDLPCSSPSAFAQTLIEPGARP